MKNYNRYLVNLHRGTKENVSFVSVVTYFRNVTIHVCESQTESTVNVSRLKNKHVPSICYVYYLAPGCNSSACSSLGVLSWKRSQSKQWRLALEGMKRKSRALTLGPRQWGLPCRLKEEKRGDSYSGARESSSFSPNELDLVSTRLFNQRQHFSIVRRIKKPGILYT